MVLRNYRDLHVTLGPWLVNGGPGWLSRYSDSLWAGTVRGSNPVVGGGAEMIRTRPDRPWGPPNLLYNEYRMFRGGKETGTWR